MFDVVTNEILWFSGWFAAVGLRLRVGFGCLVVGSYVCFFVGCFVVFGFGFGLRLFDLFGFGLYFGVVHSVL